MATDGDPTPTGVVTVDPAAPAPAVIWEAVRVLRGGGLVAFPTDTLYGLAADPRAAPAVARLFQVKGRPSDAAVPLIAAEIAQVEACAGPLSPIARRLAQQFWPGPLTVVIDAWPELDPRILGGGGTVAIRVPSHAVARALPAALGYPITATSANRSGAIPPATPAAVMTALASGVTLVLDAGPTPGVAPSTIVDARGTEPVLVRAGVVPWDRVVQSLV